MTNPTEEELAAIVAALQLPTAEEPRAATASQWKRTARLEAIGNN